MCKPGLFMLFAMVFCVAGAAGAAAPFADAAYVPPAPKAAMDAALNPIDPAILQGYLAQLDRFHVFDLLAGQTAALKTKYPAEKGQTLKGGEEVPLALAASDLFGTPIAVSDGYVFLSSIESIDAEGIRLKVNLSELDAASTVWIIDPAVPRAYGPYAPADYQGGAFWLATVFGPESVLMVHSTQAGLPKVSLEAYSHLFLSLKDLSKTLLCNISVACKGSSVTDAASATAILVIGSSGFCSGSLINNPQTTANEPLLITANHCICTGSDARSTEAYWDFRESDCGALDAGTPTSHLHSTVTKLLATDSGLDSTLLMLDSVPSGSYGRTYLGWDTRVPEVDEDVVCIHYPQATYNRSSFGRVKLVDISDSYLGYDHQNEMVWDEGVTEAGSSGSCVLFADNMRIFGTLSNGTTHTCGSDRSNNIDDFSSFRHFYSAIDQYVDSATPSTAEGKDDCGSDGLCAAKVLLKGHPALLKNLRALRDKFLLQHAATEPLVRAYYAAAPRLLQLVRQSRDIRGFFLAVALPIANASGQLL